MEVVAAPPSAEALKLREEVVQLMQENEQLKAHKASKTPRGPPPTFPIEGLEAASCESQKHAPVPAARPRSLETPALDRTDAALPTTAPFGLASHREVLEHLRDAIFKLDRVDADGAQIFCTAVGDAYTVEGELRVTLSRVYQRRPGLDRRLLAGGAQAARRPLPRQARAPRLDEARVEIKRRVGPARRRERLGRGPAKIAPPSCCSY